MKSFVLSRLVLCVCLLPLSAGAQLVPSPTASPPDPPTASPSEPPAESPPEPPAESPSEPVVDGFTLDLLRGEHSRDSNSTQISARWSGTQLEYTGPHPPCSRHRCARSALTIELSSEQVATLQSTLTTSELLTSFEEVKETNGTGWYVDARLTIRRGEAEVQLSIAGMKQFLGGGEPNLSEEARKRLDALEMLMVRLRIIAEPHFPKPGPQAP